MKKAILVATIGAMTLGVNAGDWGKAPVGKAPIEECIDLGGTIAVGYMSDYIFYGERFAESSVWGSVAYTFDGLAVPITIGAWYLNGIDSSAPVFTAAGLGAAYDELDLYASAALGTFAGFDVSVVYTRFEFPEFGAAGQNEFGIDITRSLGFVDFAAEANYNETLNAWYYQAGLSKTIGITDNMSLVLGGGVGYSDNYFLTTFADNTGWNHWYLSASLPIQLNCRTTLTPYIGYNGGGNGWIINDASNGVSPLISGEDVLHGGVSLSVTF
jgi:hypothetical protein